MTDPIDDIRRLAVLRTVQQIHAAVKRPVRSVEIYSHAMLGGEESKRVSNTLFNAKKAGLLESDASHNYSLTAAGTECLRANAHTSLDNAPPFPATSRHDKAPKAAGEPAPKAKRKYKKHAKIDDGQPLPIDTTFARNLPAALLEVIQALDRYMLLGRQDADLQLLIEKREAASAALVEWNKTI